MNGGDISTIARCFAFRRADEFAGTTASDAISKVRLPESRTARSGQPGFGTTIYIDPPDWRRLAAQ